jgi:hypothetical protein
MRINNPLNEKQLAEGDLIPKGIYDFSIINAEEVLSKSGNEMIKLQVRIYMPDGRERILFDYLLEALEFKVGHFAEATGLLDTYQSGSLNAHECIGKSGKCKIIIQADKTNQYPDKSVIADYIPTDDVQRAKTEAKINIAKQNDDGLGDVDLPF